MAKGNTTIQQFVAGLSSTQLANIVEGGGASTGDPVGRSAQPVTRPPSYESLGIPGMTLSDGPAGLRYHPQITTTTPKTYQYETAWPIGTLLAQTWDRDLVQQVGDAIGQGDEGGGCPLWLAPGMNIHRDPLNGRNFEYYSEDPLVAGLTSAATTTACRATRASASPSSTSLANNQEANRRRRSTRRSPNGHCGRSTCSGFEISVKTAQPMAIMTSYNRSTAPTPRPTTTCDTNILRGEWGFKGLVMTDWGGSHGAAPAMYAGNDLIEPGNNQAEVINATHQGAGDHRLQRLPGLQQDGQPDQDVLRTDARRADAGGHGYDDHQHHGRLQLPTCPRPRCRR